VNNLLALALILVSSTGLSAQIRYAVGQNIVPVFEGWERNADGTFNMVFGYMNRNYEEELQIPVGDDNSLLPGNPDQGQPTYFYARRQQFVFKVKVPKDWGQKDLVWTLTSRGHTEKAYGTLMPIWEIGNLVYQQNRGGPANLTYPEEPNEAPSIEMVGSAQRTIAVAEPLTLTVEVTDDGHPTPPKRRAAVVRDSDGAVIARGNAAGPRRENPITQAVVKLDPRVRLGVTWVLYRGTPGTVTFDPMKVPIVDGGAPGSSPVAGPLGGKATTRVTFNQPGTYVLRAYADDGILLDAADVTVTVSATR